MRGWLAVEELVPEGTFWYIFSATSQSSWDNGKKQGGSLFGLDTATSSEEQATCYCAGYDSVAHLGPSSTILDKNPGKSFFQGFCQG